MSMYSLVLSLLGEDTRRVTTWGLVYGGWGQVGATPSSYQLCYGTNGLHLKQATQDLNQELEDLILEDSSSGYATAGSKFQGCVDPSMSCLLTWWIVTGNREKKDVKL